MSLKIVLLKNLKIECFFNHPLGLPLNTSTLSARRDSFDRNTSAFSPSLDYNSTTVATANGNGNANRKWPVNNYGALGTMASVSPLAASGTPPPTGINSISFRFFFS